jgi:hypothetical protein
LLILQRPGPFPNGAAQEKIVPNSQEKRVAAANLLIERLLTTVLKAASSASRACHSVTDASGDDGATSFEPTRVVTRSRQVPRSDAVAELKLLPLLLGSGQRTLLRRADLRPGPLCDCLHSLGASSILVCPAVGLAGGPAGDVFIIWTGSDEAPKGTALDTLMAACVRVGEQIAAVLELCVCVGA